MRAKVVTAFVPLEGMRHFRPEHYHEYAEQMEKALSPDRFQAFRGFLLDDCWLYRYLDTRGWLDFPPATEVPPDRYPSPSHMVRSNIVQHNRTTWMRMAAREDHGADILVWLDYAILKQGDWTGKRVTPDHIARFVEAVERWYGNDENKVIQFPGIWDYGPIDPHGANWRFCGSTHVIPRPWLSQVDDLYKQVCRNWINHFRTVPLDLPIWAYVEQMRPTWFKQYKANHDATQLTNFPGYKDD